MVFFPSISGSDESSSFLFVSHKRNHVLEIFGYEEATIGNELVAQFWVEFGQEKEDQIPKHRFDVE